nr:T9SS type A sorting domain-containing protein [Bacteroidota bacterium]
MKTFSLYLTLCVFATVISAQEIPYNQLPDWQSTPMGHIATGLALTDINGDGWKDIVAANGNDIQRQSLVVYYNNGDGTFPLTPSWSSTDIDYHGHCAAGDINKDGWMDIAVSVYIGPAGFSEPGKVKVYYNTGGELESTPSFESINFYTFSCALGDADADGDLDIAVATSESYGDIWDYGKVFYNENGTFNNSPDWQSSNLMGGMDVEFGDIDNNGFLDLVFICNEFPNAIYLADETGTIDPDPDWQSSETLTYNNSLDIGFFGNDGFPGFVTTGNDQLGGDGKVRLYDFQSGVPANSAAAWLSPAVGYGSGVLLADVNKDSYLDLIYGGWWYPMEIIPGTGSSFENTPAYTSATSSVVETIQAADLGKESVVTMVDTITGTTNFSSAIRLSHQLVESIVEISRNGVTLDPDEYCYVQNKNWISLSVPLSVWDLIIVEYEISSDPDLVITNWDSSKGNYIFYNTNIPTGIHYTYRGDESGINIYPNPVRDVIHIRLHGVLERKEIDITIWDLTGNMVMKATINPHPEFMNLFTIHLQHLQAGSYFLSVQDFEIVNTNKLIVKID